MRGDGGREKENKRTSEKDTNKKNWGKKITVKGYTYWPFKLEEFKIDMSRGKYYIFESSGHNSKH